MTKQAIALSYLRCFCHGDIKGLEPLLASQLIFTGTLHSYRSASEYLASLRNNPPEKCQYNVLSVTESSDAVAVFYEYEKPNGVMKIAQLFKITNQQIDEILLVFDGRDIR